MKYSEAKPGRIFVLRLEDGEIIHESIEQFAREQGIRAASLIILGGADQESRLVVGPLQGRAPEVQIMTHTLSEVHELVGTGTLFPDESGQAVLHMHAACGRKEKTATGCIRQGVRVWQVMEVVVFELLETTAHRVTDPKLGFKMLHP